MVSDDGTPHFGVTEPRKLRDFIPAPPLRCERKSNFRVGIKVHGPMIDGSKVLYDGTVVVAGADVTEAIKEADRFCNERYPDSPVSFDIYRNPKPEGGYDF